MEFTTYLRKPIEVQAVEVTEDNIEEIAQLIGKLRHKGNGDPFIQVNFRIIPNVPRVYPGYWLTRVGEDNMRCYSKRMFSELFVKPGGFVEVVLAEPEAEGAVSG